MNKWFGAAVFAAAALCVPSFGATVLHVAIDTSSLPAGTQGYLDLQWNGGGSFGYTQTGTALISNFVNTGGSLIGAPEVYNNVTGGLPSTLQFTVDSTGGMNMYFQPIQFGSRLDFDLRLATTSPSCDATAASGCSLPGFSLDLYDPVTNSFLLTADPSGEDGFNWLLLRAEVQPDGSFVITTPPGPSGASVLTVAAVPETPVWLMLLAGFGTVGLMLRRRPKTAVI